MKIYVVVTIESGPHGIDKIVYHKDLFLFQDQAFAKARELGGSSCVMQFAFHQSWNLKEIEAEEF